METGIAPKILTDSDWVSYFSSFHLPSSFETAHGISLTPNIATGDKVTYFVFDFTTLQNVYVSDNFKKVTGHSAESGKRGFAFMQENTHPDDFPRAMMCSQKAHEVLMNLPLEDRKQSKLRMNYRLRHPEKTWVMMLHQATFEGFTEEGLPTIAIGFMFEVNDLLQFDVKIGVLELANGEIIQLNCSHEKLQLTKREKEIVVLARDGLASKNMADRLGISINTVNNIRAKLLHKTGAKNMSEVVARAMKEGLL